MHQRQETTLDHPTESSSSLGVEPTRILISSPTSGTSHITHLSIAASTYKDKQPASSISPLCLYRTPSLKRCASNHEHLPDLLNPQSQEPYPESPPSLTLLLFWSFDLYSPLNYSVKTSTMVLARYELFEPKPPVNSSSPDLSVIARLYWRTFNIGDKHNKFTTVSWRGLIS